MIDFDLTIKPLEDEIISTVKVEKKEHIKLEIAQTHEEYLRYLAYQQMGDISLKDTFKKKI